MRRAAALRLTVLWAACLLALPVKAHRLDECLQATLISIAPDHVGLEVSLTPGMEVASALAGQMDTDKDETISETEAQAYVARLVKDLSLELDDKPVILRLAGSWVSPLVELRSGDGRIRIELVAKFPTAKPGQHHLVFKNNHQPVRSVYLVNALLPATETIQIQKQERDERQQLVNVRYEMQNGR